MSWRENDDKIRMEVDGYNVKVECKTTPLSFH